MVILCYWCTDEKWVEGKPCPKCNPENTSGGGSMNGWEKESVNYWENPECPRVYLEQALRNLVIEVEGAWLSSTYLAALSDKELRREIGIYEDIADK